MENSDRAASRGRAAPRRLCGRDCFLRRGARRREPRQRRRRKSRRRSTWCGRCRRVRLVAGARGPLRERQPDGVARVSVAARLSFVYCGPCQISRGFSRRDCDGRYRYGDRRVTLVPGLRGGRFSVRALREASYGCRRTSKSAARTTRVRLLSDPADACCALMLIYVHILTTTQHLGAAATKAGYLFQSPLNGSARGRGPVVPSATAASGTSRRQRP